MGIDPDGSWINCVVGPQVSEDDHSGAEECVEFAQPRGPAREMETLARQAEGEPEEPSEVAEAIDTRMGSVLKGMGGSQSRGDWRGWRTSFASGTTLTTACNRRLL